jgi:hypothetical protein
MLQVLDCFSGAAGAAPPISSPPCTPTAPCTHLAFWLALGEVALLPLWDNCRAFQVSSAFLSCFFCALEAASLSAFAFFSVSLTLFASSLATLASRLANGYGVSRSGLWLGRGRTDLGWG